MLIIVVFILSGKRVFISFVIVVREKNFKNIDLENWLAQSEPDWAYCVAWLWLPRGRGISLVVGHMPFEV
jgi:hypothetical protein